ncbi:hypothetical protein [Rhizobium leguminosarum]|uniref:hypothetical protein n=1 Tax=Rhizobium leguminosarum TaxID=384 RepID=UPI0003AA4030|nr:hypothetical protein [Rhizobium leguminosarum]MBY2932909.1 hypothetical protein [Rhizobium leguminosarum]
MDAYLVHVLSPGDLDTIATTREAGTRIAYSEQQLSGWILAVQGVVAYLKGQPRSGGKIGILGISLGAQIASAASLGRSIIEAEVVEELRRNHLTPSSLNPPQINATIES